MLKHGIVNPLNVFDLRELSHRPPHFQEITFNCFCSEKTIKDWIYENLEGRFWLGDYFENDGGRKIIAKKIVAFENHDEASYFALMLDQFNKFENYL